MKKLISKYKIGLLLTLTGLVMMLLSCNEGNDPIDDPQPTGNEKEYSLAAVNASGVSGTATFEELVGNATRITLTLNGTANGGDHPAHIHMNSAAETGGIAIDLTNLDGASGESVTVVLETNSGTAISYEDLIDFDGYINVHNSSSDLGTLLAQGDIGQNTLTGGYVTYVLQGVANPDVSGTATLSERVSGETLIVIELTGDAGDSDHPTHIHTGSTTSPGGIVIDLTNVRAGSSITNVGALNDGTEVTYFDLSEYAGYINVHNSANDLGTIVVNGNIGSSIVAD